jgi:RNA polymerase sigma-70 factor, ECF subfamily
MTDARDDWPQRLAPEHPGREDALAELHRLLLAGARAEANRRRATLSEVVRADLDDLCVQAADDALAAVLAKLPSFRGDSRFTTWAYKFVIFEIAARLRREAWRGRRVDVDEAAWERVASADETPQQREVLRLVREGMETVLSDRQRFVFSAVALQDVPFDVVAGQLQATRGAIYKILHDARRKLRAHVEANGYGEYLP